MTLQQEIQSILGDKALSYEEKGKRLAKLVTQQELARLLPKKKEQVALKQPLKPKIVGMKTLALSIHKVYLDAILAGTKPIEFRDWGNEYYQRKCSYVENGKRYLVPFDALVFYVGRGRNAIMATVALKDITCDGTYLQFHLGEVLSTNIPKKK